MIDGRVVRVPPTVEAELAAGGLREQLERERRRTEHWHAKFVAAERMLRRLSARLGDVVGDLNELANELDDFREDAGS